MRRYTGLVFFAMLLAYGACGQPPRLNTQAASALVAAYLEPYRVTELTLESLSRSRSQYRDGYVALVGFKVPLGDGKEDLFQSQPVYITFNEVTHAYEVNRQITTVAQSVEGAIGLHQTGQYLKAHPYDPSPWKKR